MKATPAKGAAMAGTPSEARAKVSAERVIAKHPEAVTRRRWLFAVGWSGFAAVTLYVFATVLGGILDPSYSHLRHPASELTSSHAPDRWVLGGFFTAYNLALVPFGLGVYLTGIRTRALTAACVCIAAMVLGGLLMGPFPQDSLGQPATFTGAVHIALAYVVSPLIVAAVFLLAFAFRKDPLWRGTARYSVAMGFVILGTGAITGIAHAGESAFFGLFERLTIGAFLVWVLGLASHALASARREGGRADEH